MFFFPRPIDRSKKKRVAINRSGKGLKKKYLILSKIEIIAKSDLVICFNVDDYTFDVDFLTRVRIYYNVFLVWTRKVMET